jgi:hypothetical protein
VGFGCTKANRKRTACLHAKLERVRATLTERRLCVAKVRRIDDPLGSEDNIAVHEIELAADKGKVRLQSRCVCTLRG